MFKAVKNIVALVSLFTTALVAYQELRKAWSSLKRQQDQGRTTFRTSEYDGPSGQQYSSYSG